MQCAPNLDTPIHSFLINKYVKIQFLHYKISKIKRLSSVIYFGYKNSKYLSSIDVPTLIVHEMSSKIREIH